MSFIDNLDFKASGSAGGVSVDIDTTDSGRGGHGHPGADEARASAGGFLGLSTMTLVGLAAVYFFVVKK